MHPTGMTRCRGSATVRRRGRLLLPLLIACVAALATLPGCSTGEGDRAIAQEIRRQVAKPFRWFRRATVDDDDIQPLVRRFYRAHSNQPAWTHLRGPTDDARELMAELNAAPEHGLRPEDYDVPALQRRMEAVGNPLSAPTPARTADLAALDVELTRNFLKYAIHRSSGQVNPLQLPAEWHIRPRTVDVVAVLDGAVGHHRVKPALEGLDPTDPQYARLHQALIRYRALAAKGGWPAVPPGPALRRGSMGARVVALQQRLAATGDLAGGFAAGRFDGATEAAVRAFEARVGLEPDGVVRPEVLAQLDVPVGVRIRQIELNLERRRWVPDSLRQGRYVEVNIPSYSLEVVDGGTRVLAMRVVVGKQFSPTPVFSDRISYLVFNPTWNVPSTIARAEILPALQKDPDYLAKNGLRLFESDDADAREVDPHDVRWNDADSESFTYSVRGDPGDQNPLGHVKFMCPNQYDVYLHDTPSGHLFAARERGFSHGCIRVEHPRELADDLLRGKPGWDDARVAAAFAGPGAHRVLDRNRR